MKGISKLKPTKPYMLRQWKFEKEGRIVLFYTCARPGRTGSSASKSAQVPDSTVAAWVKGLPGPNLTIVSLLGRKPDGLSEYSFYTFRSDLEKLSTKPGNPSFADWLNQHFPECSLALVEHPTIDFQKIPPSLLDAIATTVDNQAANNRTIVIIDSGGQTRTGQVCKHLSAKEVFS